MAAMTFAIGGISWFLPRYLIKDRAMDFGVTERFWGRVPGMSTVNRTGEDPTLTPGAVFVFTGAALLAFGLFAL